MTAAANSSGRPTRQTEITDSSPEESHEIVASTAFPTDVGLSGPVYHRHLGPPCGGTVAYCLNAPRRSRRPSMSREALSDRRRDRYNGAQSTSNRISRQRTDRCRGLHRKCWRQRREKAPWKARSDRRHCARLCKPSSLTALLLSSAANFLHPRTPPPHRQSEAPHSPRRRRTAEPVVDARRSPGRCPSKLAAHRGASPASLSCTG